MKGKATRNQDIYVTHPIETSGNQAISALRNLVVEQSAENETHLVPEVYFSWDSDDGEVSIAVESRPDELLAMDVQIDAEPLWLTLNIGLGSTQFEVGDTLTIVAEVQGTEDAAFPMFIRSAHDGYTTDTVLHDVLKSSSDDMVQTLLHTIQHDEGLLGEEAYHTLVIQLPKSNFSLSLRDARLVFIPAARGLRSLPQTLSAVAG